MTMRKRSAPPCLLAAVLLSLLVTTQYATLFCSAQEETTKKKKKKEDITSLWELISWYAADGDMEGLHQHAKTLFDASERQVNPSKRRIPVPSDVKDRGGGFHLTTRHKLLHDMEQFQFMLNYPGMNFNPMTRELLEVEIPRAYQGALDKLDAYFLNHPERDEESEFYPLEPGDPVLEWYNRAFFTPTFGDKVKQPAAKQYGNQLASTSYAPLLNPNLDFELYQRQWLGEEPSHEHPGIVVIDNLLSEPALTKVRELLLLSTVWFETKTPRYGKYVGAYIGDGLHDKLLLTIADDLFKAMPRVMEQHYLKYMWAYHYESSNDDPSSNNSNSTGGIHTHADDAAVNVNIWLTPDEANLDPHTGGLVVYTTKPPDHWGFTEFNSNWEFVNEHLLEPNGFANVTIPYRQNRAVLFDSFLFHKTDQFYFKQGYANRRINLTILYGNRQSSTTTSSKDNKEEL